MITTSSIFYPKKRISYFFRFLHLLYVKRAILFLFGIGICSSSVYWIYLTSFLSNLSKKHIFLIFSILDFLAILQIFSYSCIVLNNIFYGNSNYLFYFIIG